MIDIAQYITDNVANAEVERLVNRIPATYLPIAEKQQIVQNLAARGRNLRTILGI